MSCQLKFDRILVFGADDLVAISEDLWMSVKELNCMNDWRVLAASQKEIQGTLSSCSITGNRGSADCIALLRTL